METPRLQLGSTFGAGYVGGQVTGVLYGLTTLQTYLYYVYYPKDSTFLKTTVGTIWILDTIHFALVCVCMYHYLVANYDYPPALATGHWSLFVSLLLNVIIAVIVQSFFTLQIFRLCSRRFRWWVTSGIFLTVVGHFAFGIETVVDFFIKKDFAALQAPDVLFRAATPFAVFVVVSDILITIALSILLYESRSGVRSTNAVIQTLIIYAVNRCLLTSLVAIIEVILFALAPHSLWFLAIDFTVGKLYANSLLATLNTRKALRSQSESRVGTQRSRSSIVIGVSSSQAGSESKSRTQGTFLDLNMTRNTNTSCGEGETSIELSTRQGIDSKV